MAIKVYNASGLTGGTARKLDSYAVANLFNGDRAITVDTNKMYLHVFDATGTDVESSPAVIRPDDFSTAGVWRMAGSPYGDISPVGSVIIWTTDTAPTGYLECNGAAVSRSSYSSLFAVIGDDYGVGDGSTTFNLPDYRGEFLRGWAHGSTNDPDKATRTNRGDGTTGDYVGTKQSDQIESHTHTIGNSGEDGSAGPPHLNVSNLSTNNGFSTAANGGNETRPRNVNVMYCIKY